METPAQTDDLQCPVRDKRRRKKTVMGIHWMLNR
jgi:hypothetical protein